MRWCCQSEFTTGYGISPWYAYRMWCEAEVTRYLAKFYETVI